MATPKELADAIEAGLTNAPPRMVSDYRTDLSNLPAGASGLQIRVALAGSDPTPRSAVTRRVVNVGVSIFHKLSDPMDERAYTEAALQIHLGELGDTDWWRGLAQAHSIVSLPDVSLDRLGNVISAEVETQVSLAS